VSTRAGTTYLVRLAHAASSCNATPDRLGAHRDGNLVSDQGIRGSAISIYLSDAPRYPTPVEFEPAWNQQRNPPPTLPSPP